MNSTPDNLLQGAGISVSETLNYLHSGAVLIAATPVLTADWKRRAVSHISSVVATPDVVTWSHWLADMASIYADMPVPFTKHQEMQLWEQVIHHDLPEERSSSVRGLAKHAAAAWGWMQEYIIDVRELNLGGDEADALARWICTLQAKLTTEKFSGRVLTADIPHHLYTQLQTYQQGSACPGHLILDGFETFTPMQTQILDMLQQHGCDVLHVRKTGQIPNMTLTPCPDEVGEFSHVAQRIKSLLAQDTDMRIAVLTEGGCDIAAFRRILNGVLITDACADPAREMQAVAMVGDALVAKPMVQQALHLLSLAGKHSMAFDDFSPLLFTPWLLGYQIERMSRAALEAKFREQNRHQLSLKGLLKSADMQALPSLLSVIQALHGWKTRSQSATNWVKSVHALLLTAGFVRTGLEHEQPYNNLEIRQMNAFRDMLTSLVALDAVVSMLSWMDFLARLRTACAETRLNLTPVYPNVVVMPQDQAIGLQFDHILAMGLDDESFPSPVRPQPLLPVHLQQKYGIPMSSAAQVFASSRWQWEQLAQLASNIECSYARQRDEREVLPSSFVLELPEKNMAHADSLLQPFELEIFEDAPDVPILTDEEVHGGTSIIKNQSACPFRAFARHRLKIDRLGETMPGIEASKKGSLIHLALEFIWGKLVSQAALLQLTASKRGCLLNAAIAYAWQESRIFRNADIQTIEKERMRQVLNAWLDVEATRPPFEVIENEKIYHLSLPEAAEHSCAIHIKVDRIDQDVAGRRILIDYKTGEKQSIAKWLGERMEEPQLPLYALAAGISADDAVTFATLRSGDEMGFEGLVGEDIEISGITICDSKYKHPADWQQVLDDWRIYINALAQEFVAGRSEVAPRNSNACVYCGLEAVCRIEEIGFESDIEDET